MNHHKKYQSSIVNSTREIDVSIYICIHLCPLQPDGQIINRIYEHQSDESSQKKNQTSILDSKRENHVFVFLHFCYLQPDGQTDGQIIHRIDKHKSDESSQKNQTSILNSRRENHVSVFFNISAICSLTNRLTEKLSIEQIRINQKNLHKKIRPLSYIADEKFCCCLYFYISAICSLTDKFLKNARKIYGKVEKKK